MIRVGESVTWSKVSLFKTYLSYAVKWLFDNKLHMIENRAKIEKQIFMGRQYIRRALRRQQLPDQQASMLLQLANETPNTHLHPSSDQPISVDPDAEAAFRRGSRWFFKRGHSHTSPSPTLVTNPEDTSPRDPLRFSSIRRKWTSELLSPASTVPKSFISDFPTHLPSVSSGSQSRASRSDGFLSRLRSRSFTNLAVEKSLSGESSEVSEHAWSNNSSSEDGLTVDDWWHQPYVSTLNSYVLDELQHSGGFIRLVVMQSCIN